MHWYLQSLTKYALFDGCAKRQEFWTFVLVNAAICLVLIAIEKVAGTHGVVRTLFGLAVLFPSLAVTVRRLHDTGRSGWWVLIWLIPVAGAIVLFIYLLEESKEPLRAEPELEGGVIGMARRLRRRLGERAGNGSAAEASRDTG
jgi:uncharacterized membrane protein YhaH (DUF805 family)